MQPFPVLVKSDRVVSLLTDIESYKDAELVVHAWPPHRRPGRSAAGRRRTAGSHVTRRPTPTMGRPGPYQRSADATRPGDNTPGSCERQGR
ncbi:hypothetical protein Phou_015030 [Phytohabitans houttuyneae]|uniref:Uncharacterized protein n=1 Tax=Phytohabitans houttuyneae TaxID=1076126 RepID=A0A6V8JX52_9ACTN|nr:hypothetical protein Phou_015030 [Phytohabitans houttuyneae]